MNLADPSLSLLLRRRRLLQAGLHTGLLAAGLLGAGRARAMGEHAGHAAHAQAAGSSAVRRSDVTLRPADVTVTREDGRSQALRPLLDDGRPVMLNFIYTSCNAICPVTTQVFREVRERLGTRRDDVLTVSVSIDPEYDTPTRLAEYARRFDGGTPSWRFLTASLKDAVAIQQSFEAWQGDKMNHLPVSFLRPAPGQPWVRFDGFASPAMLTQALQPMLVTSRPRGATTTASR